MYEVLPPLVVVPETKVIVPPFGVVSVDSVRNDYFPSELVEV